MKITDVRERLIAPASLRNAWLISRACSPGSESPMSPSISAFGTSAATESTTTTSTAPERTRISVISSPCSPVSGCETSRLSMSTPSFLAYSTSSACSASMYAAAPPCRWECATTCSANVVLPLDSGPKISVTRPRGIPPMPIAASRLIAPVGIASTRTWGESAPIRMMAPLPHVFSICVIARLSALRRSSVSLGASFSAAMSVLDMGWEPPRERPEYIPKPGLAPPGTERVCHVLQPSVRNRDAIEPVDVGGLAEAVHPHARGFHQLTALGPRHGLERAAERRSPARFHFDKGDEVPLAGDQVDLRVTDPESMRHDVAPARQEVADRLLLPRQAPPLALVLPFRRIAPQPALHGCKLIASPGAGEPFCCEWCAVIAERRRWRLGGGTSTNLHQPPQPPQPPQPVFNLASEDFRQPHDPAGDAHQDPQEAQVVAHPRTFLRHHQLIAVLHVHVVERTPLRHGLGEGFAVQQAVAAPFQPHLARLGGRECAPGGHERVGHEGIGGHRQVAPAPPPPPHPHPHPRPGPPPPPPPALAPPV